ncbi:S1C family serine protease [Candidatus Methylacidithermus pantelleriae]|uniref:Serine protease Do n=1 Tax=Candidatus Methylacidithermus pantelleriae TaxID=2744239 RepID=A0A8J2BLP4_9BACT|nr:trypsin-like peptidase domain-containing protein [Candidatus Methylacidithermus pantelleriae]CAF0703672.1 Serine protease Do [Candidatus Methylacidithermus pantelleriae]
MGIGSAGRVLGKNTLKVFWLAGLVSFCLGLSLSPGGTKAFLFAVSPQEEPVVQVVQKVLPAVVNLSSEKVVHAPVQDPFELFFGRFYVPQRVRSLGSGVLIDSHGRILTCAHVVERALRGQVRVTLSNGVVSLGQVLLSDPEADLALVEIPAPKPFPFLDVRRLSPNYLGQTVIVLGNPVGYENSVSRGILSAHNRTIQTEQGLVRGLLQTDAAINPGNSGGPIVDIQGAFVGIATAKFAGNAIEGIGFAIPGRQVVAWLSEVARGRTPPDWQALVRRFEERIGAQLQDVTPELAFSLHLPTSSGLLLSEVEPGGPAARAGLEAGMVIVAVEGTPVTDLRSLPVYWTRLGRGDPLSLSIVAVREGNGILLEQKATVTLYLR